MATAKKKLASKEEKLKDNSVAKKTKEKKLGKVQSKAKADMAEEEEEAEDDNMPKGKKNKNKNFVEVESDEARKLSYGKGLAVPMRIPGFSTDNVLDKIERKIGIGSTGMGSDNENRMSTSMLMYDLILGGGITAGWYTNFGKEQSCKSTAAMTFTAAAISAGIPVITVFDFEGSTEPTYLQNLMNTQGVNASITDVFGIRDHKGDYVKKPRVRYIPASTAEVFFDHLASLERTLPDKIYESGEWWYVYDNTNENRAKLAGEEIDKKKFSKHNKFYVKATDGSLQALYIVDSYPSMLPERLSEEDASAGLGAVARMFSEQLPRVKGKMRKKRIAVIGVNQLRDAPMVRYGSPEYEPCGNAIKFYSDARIKHMARAISAVGDAKASKDSPFEAEDSVEFDGVDTYRYISIKAEKNKLSTPYMSGFVRLWIKDGEGKARGFDPVYDTLTYLRATGQIYEKNKRKDILLKFVGNEAKKPVDWTSFKKLVLGTKAEIAEICTKAGMKPFLLRKHCFKQIANKTGLEMFVAKQSMGKKAVLRDAEESE